MSGIQPVALYAMRVPPGDFVLPATPGHAAMIRVTMASIDPTAEPDNQDVNSTGPMRSTLKVIRGPMGDDDYEDLLDSEDYSDEDDEDEDDLDDDDDEEEEELNGGPSAPKKLEKATIKPESADDDEDMDDAEGDDDDDEDDEDSEEVEKQLARILAKVNKGKGKAKALDVDDESDEDDDLDMDDMNDEDDEPIVVCTLDTNHHYQQTLDLVVGANEEVYFMVTGTHAVHLTGNYVLPEDDGRAALYDDDDDSDEEAEYDLSPGEDELDALDALIDGDDDESDALDDLPNPRITELGPEDDMPRAAKKTETPKTNGVKPSAKRPAEDSDEEEDLDNMIAEEAEKAGPSVTVSETTVTTEPSKKLSKAEKKKLKKLKNNDGNAVDPPSTDGTIDNSKDTKADKSTPNGEKKVQFAKKLEQGPTGSKATTSAADAASDKKPFPTRTVQGVTISDRKAGAGPTASTKSKSRIEMRYIGKLSNGQVFDSNKKGAPFVVTLGRGDVIPGFSVGLEGIQAGAERRLTIPPKMGYGNKKMPGIPAGSELVFDVKCLSVS